MLDSLDGRVDGPDLSLDIETLQTLAETEGGIEQLSHNQEMELSLICDNRSEHG